VHRLRRLRRRLPQRRRDALRRREDLHLRHLPQGKAEQDRRALAMVGQMDAEGFGNCSNYYECEAVCPKEISVKVIAEMNRDYFKASLLAQEGKAADGGA
jgi:succinate dehydrogenase / fumarate reductase iron-sulfur subunit